MLLWENSILRLSILPLQETDLVTLSVTAQENCGPEWVSTSMITQPASGQVATGLPLYTATDYKAREQDGATGRMEKETKDSKFQCLRTMGLLRAQFC